MMYLMAAIEEDCVYVCDKMEVIMCELWQCWFVCDCKGAYPCIMQLRIK